MPDMQAQYDVGPLLQETLAVTPQGAAARARGSDVAGEGVGAGEARRLRLGRRQPWNEDEERAMSEPFGVEFGPVGLPTSQRARRRAGHRGHQRMTHVRSPLAPERHHRSPLPTGRTWTRTRTRTPGTLGEGKDGDSLLPVSPVAQAAATGFPVSRSRSGGLRGSRTAREEAKWGEGAAGDAESSDWRSDGGTNSRQRDDESVYDGLVQSWED